MGGARGSPCSVALGSVTRLEGFRSRVLDAGRSVEVTKALAGGCSGSAEHLPDAIPRAAVRSGCYDQRAQAHVGRAVGIARVLDCDSQPALCAGHPIGIAEIEGLEVRAHLVGAPVEVLVGPVREVGSLYRHVNLRT